jgi:transposase
VVSLYIERWLTAPVQMPQNLFLQNIPPYSPELNKIEILWRKIKYERLNFSAYESFAALKENLNHIFSNFRGGGVRRVPPLDPPLNR